MEVGRMLKSAPSVCLLKVARTKSLDAIALDTNRAVGRKSLQGGLLLSSRLPQIAGEDSFSEVDSIGAREPPITPPSAFASLVPTPVTEVPDPPIIPPPPPLSLDLAEDVRSNNTQSDVDSDVLDSSRSELERIYVSNEQYLQGDGGESDDDDLEAAFAAAAAVHASVDGGEFYPGFNGHKNVAEKKQISSGDGTNSFNGASGPGHAFAESKNMTRTADTSETARFTIGDSGDDNSGGDVSPAGTLKNESPVSDSSTESMVQSPLEESKSPKRSLVRQPRVMEAVEDVHNAAVNGAQAEYQEFVVDLEKAPGGGLGFTVAGGASTTGGCYVKAVVQDPALSDGRLRSGDRLIQVNGQDMTGLSHFEAVTFLRQTPQKVSIRVRRYVNVPDHNPPHRGEKSGPPNASNQFSGASTHDERHSQKLAPHPQSGERPSESAEGRRQWREGVAEEESEKRRSVKDLIRSLDTPKAIIKPYEYGRQQSQTEEKKEETSKQKEKEINNGEEIKMMKNGEPTTEAGVKRIVLKKEDSADSLGFSLIQHKVDGQSGIFIKTLSAGGIALTDGQLRVGDKLLQVNRTSLIGQSHTKAIRILREAGGSVVLTISRSSGEQQEFDAALDRQTGEELDDRHHPPADTASSNNTNSDTDDDINNLLDEAMNYLENEENCAKGMAVGASAKSPTPQPRPRSRGQAPVKPTRRTGRKMNHKERSASDDSQSSSKVQNLSDRNSNVGNINSIGHAATDTVNSTSGSTHDRVNFNSFENFWDNKSVLKFARHLSSVDVPEQLTAEWLSSLPLLALGKDAEDLSTQLLQSLADAIEQEEPVVEFKNLRQVRATDNSEVAKLPENKYRNRYRNVLPYDFNRVRLKDESDGNDYINASHVRLTAGGGEEQLLYITCQGPLAATLADFWTMVWEAGTNVVTMVTQEVESGKVKCHVYWPLSTEQPLELCDGKYSVTLVKVEAVDDFIIRHLKLREKTSGDQRDIVHLHCTTWPDHGVPDTALPLLRFLRLMHVFHRTGPLVVHCSAGIGRSGVLMAIDTALARMETGDKLDLFDIVSELRRQRHGMIQTQEQYLFCYTACMEALLSMES